MDVSDTLNLFLLGEGEGVSQRRREGGEFDFLLRILARGAFQGEGPKGREGVCGELGNWGGGGEG